MNLKKTVIISLAALACAGFIAGCGSDKKDAASADPAKTKNEIKHFNHVLSLPVITSQETGIEFSFINEIVRKPFYFEVIYT